MILLLDHDDSFVFTLARYVAELGEGEEPEVVRVAATSIQEIEARAPARIILSPGPGRPEDWTTSVAVVRRFGPAIPILGVCLGHQCIAAAYGASVGRTPHPRHGRTSTVTHDGRGILAQVPSPFQAARYHSLVVLRETLPAELVESAVADDGDVMGIRHRTHAVEGVQFHPESIITEWGHRMIANFLGRPGASCGKDADRSPLCFTPCVPSSPRAS